MELKSITLLISVLLLSAAEARLGTGLRNLNYRNLIDMASSSSFTVKCFWFNTDDLIVYDLKDLKSTSTQE